MAKTKTEPSSKAKTDETKDKSTGESHAFQAEVAKLLDIVIHSLYSEKEIFLRELISNASDACDLLRYRALTEPALVGDDPDLAVSVSFDKKARTLTVADNGIGMNHDELVENLGTIARSGTSQFMSQLTGDAKKDVALIGQFGVGFYSSFMVAERVEAFARKAGEAEGWRWSSQGGGAFDVEPAEDVARGTRIVLHLRKGESEWFDASRLETIIKTYSDHIALPIRLVDGGETRTVNTSSALWQRPKNEITDEQYGEFYHHVAHGLDQPWLTVHVRAEGKIQYASLLFVPGTPPYDMFDPQRRHRVRLYVKRVFITDECEGLIPPFLRFLRGVVDSDDLPLNVSREMLQDNPIVRKIRSGVVKRLFAELGKKAEKAPDDYAVFWTNFGAVLKEGLYEDPDQREAIFKLARFRSTADDGGWTSLEDYVGRMTEGQAAIYYITGDDAGLLRKSPQLEGYARKGVEVLLLSDPIDEFWIGAVGAFNDVVFRSATRGGADLGLITEPDASAEATADETAEPKTDIAPLVVVLKLALGDEVKDVRESDRLTDSPVCLVADEGDMDMHLERLLRQHQQVEGHTARVLELNPDHPLIRTLAGRVGVDGTGNDLDEAAWLLFEQARILEGEPPSDPTGFARRLSAVMTKGLAG
jgi:molecular chaperone HtpG